MYTRKNEPKAGCAGWDLSRRELLRRTGVGVAVGVTGLLVPGSGAAEAAVVAPAPAGKTPPLSAEEMAAVDAALGKKGKYIESEATYTVPLPRADLKVSVKGQPVPTGLGFGGWVSVKRTLDGKSAVLMGDTVLLQEEVNPLIDAVHQNGLDIGALHNHFFYEEPRIFYMHVHGMGQPADLIRKYAAAIRETRIFPANQPAAGSPPAKTAKEIFDLPALDKIVGHTGAVNGATYKYTIGRPDLTVVAMGAEITTTIGLNTWMALAGTSEIAHAAGDVAMLGAEVNPVIEVLRSNGIEVVAVHNHMIGDDPHILFLHYYGTGRAEKLARGFRAALDELGRHGGGSGEMPGMKM